MYRSGFQFGNRYFHCWDPATGHIGATSILAQCDRSSRVTSTSTSLASRSGSSAWSPAGVEPWLPRDRTGIKLAPTSPTPLFPYFGRARYYNKQLRTAWLEPVRSCQSGDRPGRKCADRGQHGAVLHGACHGRRRAAPDHRTASTAGYARASFHYLTAAQMAGIRRGAHSGVVVRGHGAAARQIQGVAVAGKTGSAPEPG